MATTIKINRAPVLTLWVVIVAERLGYKHDEALTFGKAVAGLNAQSKGQRLGIYTKAEEELDAKRGQKAEERRFGEAVMIQVTGRLVPAVQTENGLRATIKGEEISPESVERYLVNKFGEDLSAVRGALEALAQSYSSHELEQRAYTLYEQFRPVIPEGKRGWGAAGDLDLERIHKLAKRVN